MDNIIKNKLVLDNEQIINQIEIEELESRLENKWGTPICLSIDGCDPKPSDL